MKKSEIAFVLKSFLIWRVGLFLILFLAVRFIPLQEHFLGGGMANYLKAPWFWAWANFDGEHYLAIAQNGYGGGEQAFFPLYPLLISFFGGNSLTSLNWAGLIIANLSFLLALIGLYKLTNSKTTIILLLLFPTSFYFGSVYTESLFLALVVWSFYFFKKEKYLSAGVLGAFASATRVTGILLLPVYLIELVIKKKKLTINYFPLIMIASGLLAYMFYLYLAKGDYLAFLHTLPGFGEQRSATPILLPQVFYRYVFKILPNLNYAYFAGTFTTMVEFLTGAIFLIVSIISFFKLKLSYSLFLILGYLIPTLSGSFSSLPRYVLVLFPAFILFSIWFNKIPKLLKMICYTILIVLLIISLFLFSRGYWLA